MAQGAHKQKSTSAIMKQQQQLAKSKNSGRIVRGLKSNPKQGTHLAKEKKMEKKLNSKNIQNLEYQMALKAGQTGKLTLMKGLADKAKAEYDAKPKKGKKREVAK